MANNNLERLSRLFDAFRADDRETVSALLHPHFTITEADGLPYGGTYHGVNGWWQLIERIVGTYSDLSTTPLEIIGEPDGDRFAALHRLTGTARATGIRVDLQIFELWVFQDATVIEVRPFYWDTHAIATATRMRDTAART